MSEEHSGQGLVMLKPAMPALKAGWRRWIETPASRPIVTERVYVAKSGGGTYWGTGCCPEAAYVEAVRKATEAGEW
jgi:hypothetical protein